MEEYFFSIRRHHQVEFCSNFWLSQDAAIIVSSVSSFPILRSSRASLHLVSKCQVRRRYQHFHFFWFHHGQFLILCTRIATRSFSSFCQTELITPILYCRKDTDLIHRMNCLKQEFRIPKISIEVFRILTFFLLQDFIVQCTGTFEDKITSPLESLYHFVGCAIPLSFVIVRIAIPSFFLPWTQKCPMSWKVFLRVKINNVENP